MLPLTYPRAWLAAGLVMVAVIIAASLAPQPMVDPLTVGNDKITHALAYVALTFWFTGLYPRARYLRIAVTLVLLGLAIEELQALTRLGRQRDFNDVLANATGIAIGLLLARNLTGGWVQRLETWLLRK